MASQPVLLAGIARFESTAPAGTVALSQRHKKFGQLHGSVRVREMSIIIFKFLGHGVGLPHESGEVRERREKVELMRKEGRKKVCVFEGTEYTVDANYVHAQALQLMQLKQQQTTCSSAGGRRKACPS